MSNILLLSFLAAYIRGIASLTCCRPHTSRASCLSESGSQCVWLEADDPVALDAGTQCLGEAYAACKQLHGVTARCGDAGPGPSDPQDGPENPDPPICDYEKKCVLGENYFFEGLPCIISGDPHTKLVNGNRHDFQGQPYIETAEGIKNQFYYFYPCAGSTVESMPITVLGTHQRWHTHTVSGIDYLVISLYPDGKNGPKYDLYFSANIHSWIKNGFSTIYDDLATASLTSFVHGTPTEFGGDRFLVTYHQTAANKQISVKILIDGEQEFSLFMSGQTNFVGGRYRMHYIQMSMPSSLKCHACGLCGDYQRPMTGLQTEQLLGCDGTLVDYRAGWNAHYTPEAYDLDGWTWEKSYVETKCQNYDTSTNNGDDFQWVDPCPSDIADLVKEECEKQRNAAKKCCNKIGGQFCDELQGDCNVDACAAVEGDKTKIEAEVTKLMSAAIDEVCEIPDIAEQFEDAPEAVLACPAGSVEVAKDVNFHSCGLTSCKDRYDYETIEDCEAACQASPDCKGYNWARACKNGEKNECTLYPEKSPDAESIPKAFECFTQKSQKSAARVGAVASVECPKWYKLTSCGFQTADESSTKFTGSYIKGETCYAKSADTQGVFAYARCCKLKIEDWNSVCTTKKSAISGLKDDDQTFAQCDEGQTMLGCTASGAGPNLDGTYPSNTFLAAEFAGHTSTFDTCGGWNSYVSGNVNKNGVYSYATCCESEQPTKAHFECVTQWSGRLTKDKDISVSCPADYPTMTGCTGSTAWSGVNQWFVAEDDTCRIRNLHASETGKNWAQAGAICCRAATPPTPIPNIFCKLGETCSLKSYSFGDDTSEVTVSTDGGQTWTVAATKNLWIHMVEVDVPSITGNTILRYKIHNNAGWGGLLASVHVVNDADLTRTATINTDNPLKNFQIISDDVSLDSLYYWQNGGETANKIWGRWVNPTNYPQVSSDANWVWKWSWFYNDIIFELDFSKHKNTLRQLGCAVTTTKRDLYPVQQKTINTFKYQQKQLAHHSHNLYQPKIAEEVVDDGKNNNYNFYFVSAFGVLVYVIGSVYYYRKYHYNKDDKYIALEEAQKI